MSPEYFKTKLRPYEAEAFLEGVATKGREGWEQTRRLAYYILAPWSKDLDPKTFFPLPWDERQSDEPTEDDLKDLYEWGDMVARNMNSNGGYSSETKTR